MLCFHWEDFIEFSLHYQIYSLGLQLLIIFAIEYSTNYSDKQSNGKNIV